MKQTKLDIVKSFIQIYFQWLRLQTGLALCLISQEYNIFPSF